MVRKKEFSLKELSKDLKKVSSRSLQFGLHMRWKIALGLTTGAVLTGGVIYALVQRQKELEKEKLTATTPQQVQKIEKQQQVLETQIQKAKEQKEKETQLKKQQEATEKEKEAQLKKQQEAAEKLKKELEKEKLTATTPQQVQKIEKEQQDLEKLKKEKEAQLKKELEATEKLKKELEKEKEAQLKKELKKVEKEIQEATTPQQVQKITEKEKKQIQEYRKQAAEKLKKRQEEAKLTATTPQQVQKITKEQEVAEKLNAVRIGNKTRGEVEIIKKHGGFENIKNKKDKYWKDYVDTYEECQKLLEEKKDDKTILECYGRENKKYNIYKEIVNIQLIDINKHDTNVKNLQNNYEYYLAALYYTNYELGVPHTMQFNFFYFEIISIIVKFYRNKYERVNILVEHRFKIFLNLGKKEKDTCIVHADEITINNYKQSNAEIQIYDMGIFKNTISDCLRTKKKYIILFITLKNSQGDNHSYHRNSIIIFPTEKKIWRLEPNFHLDNLQMEENLKKKVKIQFEKDNLKKGVYPVIGYNNYVNRELYKFFNENEINGQKFSFEGYYSTSQNECGFHGGLCKLISVLLSHLERDITAFDIKWYIYKYFVWEFNNIYKSTYNINKYRLEILSTFINENYKTHTIKFNGKDLKDVKFNEINEMIITNLNMDDGYGKIVKTLTFVKQTDEQLKKQKVLSFGKRKRFIF